MKLSEAVDVKTGQVKGAAAPVGEDDLASLSRNTGAMQRCVVNAHSRNACLQALFCGDLMCFRALVSRVES